MDLVAGDARDIVLALAVDDTSAFDDRDRFVAHLPLGGGLDPTWLDLFSEAVRSVSANEELADFLDARSELENGGSSTERIVERVDAEWIEGVAGLPDDALGALSSSARVVGPSPLKGRMILRAVTSSTREMPATKSATYSSLGLVTMSSGVPICTMRPFFMIAIRSPRRIASSRSWVMKIVVL